MIKVSHELPNNMLHMSNTINDYEYCLPHLLDYKGDWEDIYKDHFIQAKKEGRYIIMDNSLHELGEAYAKDRLMHWLYELRPDEFIVPDVWENQITTIANAEKWMDIGIPAMTKKVAVVQAKSFEEAGACYVSLRLIGYK